MPWYTVTSAGWSVERASAAPRITRRTAESALQEFMSRVQLANSNPRYLYTVKKVVVFGSFLESREDLGDVDVAVDLESRVPIERSRNWVEIFRQHASASGREFSTFDSEIDWPRQEVILVFKSRKRSISIQSWFSFLELAKTSNLRSKVLFGDANEIRAEVAAARSHQRD